MAQRRGPGTEPCHRPAGGARLEPANQAEEQGMAELRTNLTIDPQRLWDS